MANSLSLVGDGDDLEIIQTLEEVFEIAFSDGELKALRNVGDLHDLILQKVPRASGARKCASAMAFYRLRRALTASRPDLRITQATEMAGFSEASLKLFFRRLSQQTGFRLAGPAHTWVGYVGETCLLFPLMAILPLLAWSAIVQPVPLLFVGLAGSFVLGLILVRFDPGRLVGTVGSLAREAARANYGRLMKQGARGGDHEIWLILVEALIQESRLGPREVTRETVFFRSQLKTA
jgi:hypothetical protein